MYRAAKSPFVQTLVAFHFKSKKRRHSIFATKLITCISNLNLTTLNIFIFSEAREIVAEGKLVVAKV